MARDKVDHSGQILLGKGSRLTQVHALAVQNVAGDARQGAQAVTACVALAEAAAQRRRHEQGRQQQQVRQPDEADGRVPQQQEVALQGGRAAESRRLTSAIG